MRDVNPTLRGFLIILAIAGLITAAGAEAGLYAVLLVLRILFILAIAFFLYALWRRNREEISIWSRRARAVFYGAAGVAVGNLVASFVLEYPAGGLEALVFFVVFAACGFAMWRVWRDEHTYGY